MKYRALRTFATINATFHEGEIYELSPATALELLGQGLVEEHKALASEPKAKPFRSASKAETSVAPDVEVASDL